VTQASRHQGKQFGLTLIEALVVVALVGVLVGIGFAVIPREGFALNQAAEGLARDYQFARFEAIRRNEFVGLEVLPGSDSYRIFTDLNRNAVFDSGTDQTIKTVSLGDGGVSLSGTTAQLLVFDPRGLNPTTFAGERPMRLSTAGGRATYVCVNTNGRTRISQGGCS
jgi:type IV fimbrial biogenesis protein FimT